MTDEEKKKADDLKKAAAEGHKPGKPAEVPGAKKGETPQETAERTTQTQNKAAGDGKSTTDAGAGMGNAKAQQAVLKQQAAGDDPNGSDGSNKFYDSSASVQNRDVGKLDGKAKKGEEEVKVDAQ